MLQHRVEAGADSPHEPASYSDYVIAKLKFEGRSLRWLAAHTGITRSRIHRILHGDPARRRPLRIDEKQLILTALKVDDYVAALTTELMGLNPDQDFLETVKIADMLSVMFRGLACRVADVIRHIDGFEPGDIRPEHGAVLHEAVIRTVRANWEGIARRRGIRLDDIFVGNIA